MPVAGPVGLGSAALAAELGVDALKIIGVDVDQYVTDPEHKGVYLTSVDEEDGLDRVSGDQGGDGRHLQGRRRGRHARSPAASASRRIHDLESAVPAELKAEIEALQKGIIDGSINVKGG